MATYVMSDLHGVYDKYIDMLNLISFSEKDKLYILGDIIDRGTASVKLFCDIMKRNNVVALLGNHELMMYDALTKNGRSYYYLWMNNGGEMTEEELSQLSDEEIENVIEYVSNMPVVIPELVVNDKKYYLAHSACARNALTVGNVKSDYYGVSKLVWTRLYPFFNFAKSNLFPDMNNRMLITGHTMTWNYTLEDPSKTPGRIYTDTDSHFIGIDCGCASYACGNKNGRLGCLRLDDFKEFYT